LTTPEESRAQALTDRLRLRNEDEKRKLPEGVRREAAGTYPDPIGQTNGKTVSEYGLIKVDQLEVVGWRDEVVRADVAMGDLSRMEAPKRTRRFPDNFRSVNKIETSLETVERGSLESWGKESLKAVLADEFGVDTKLVEHF
jgi:hypothetical protein